IHVLNNPPVANAGPDNNVQTGVAVGLDGSKSFDPDGDLITYAWSIDWSLTAKPAASILTNNAISGRTTPKPRFTPDVDGSYTFQLIVNDGQDNSAPAFVTLTASTPNVPPNANAGPDQTAIQGALVLLDGRASHDPDNGPQPLTFRWTFVSVPTGSTLTNSNILTADRAQASFVPDVPGVYVLNLHVSDGQDSADATMKVTVARDVPPNARAGDDQTVHLGDTVHLDGSDSDDQDNGPQPLTFQWRFVSVAAGSHLTNANLHDAQTAQPSFTPDVVGHYVLELVVFDSWARAFDNVTVTVLLPLRCTQAVASPSQLWPPNHQLVAVNIVGVTAPADDPVALAILGVTPDEDVLAKGSGNTCPDAFIQGASVQVAAVRAGLQTG